MTREQLIEKRIIEIEDLLDVIEDEKEKESLRNEVNILYNEIENKIDERLC